MNIIFSYDDGIDGAINNNLKVMFGGFSLIFFYIVITLGRYNCIEQRVSIFFPYTDIWSKMFPFLDFFSPPIFILKNPSIFIFQVLLSLMGMVVIVLALGASFGFCFYMGIFFADIHPVIPFLLLGIGKRTLKYIRDYNLDSRLPLFLENVSHFNQY